MGTCFVRVEAAVDKGEEEEEDLRLDNRKRNSLVFSVIDWVETGFGTRARAAIFAAIASRRRRADATATVFVICRARPTRRFEGGSSPRRRVAATGPWRRVAVAYRGNTAAAVRIAATGRGDAAAAVRIAATGRGGVDATAPQAPNPRSSRFS